MPDKVVEVPGVGNVAFPDSMKDEEISAQVRKMMAGQGKPADVDKGWFDSTVDAVSRFFGGANDTANPVSAKAREANAQLVTHPIDTAKGMLAAQGELANKAGESFKNGDYLTGVRHAIAYLVPVLGPAIDHAGDRAQGGDVAGGLGEAAGIAVPAALGMRPKAPVAPTVGPSKLASDQYRAALRPRINTPAADVREMVNTGLAHELTVDEAGGAKLTALIQDLGRTIDAKAAEASQRGVTVDPAAVAQRVDEVSARRQLQANPSKDLKTVAASKSEFLDQHTPPAPKLSSLVQPNGQPFPAPAAAGPTPIAADTANQIKQGTYQKLAGEYGELSQAQIEAQKALARGLKEELSAKIPELAELNEKQGRLLELQPVLEAAINRAANGQSAGAFRSLVTTGVAHSVTGSSGVGLVTGVLQKVLADPSVRSRLAIAINHAQQKNPGKFGVPSMRTAAARVDAIASALSDSAQGDPGQP